MDGGVHRGREGGLGRDGIIFYSAILRIASPIGLGRAGQRVGWNLAFLIVDR